MTDEHATRWTLAAFPLGDGWGVVVWLAIAGALLMVMSLASIWKARAHSRRARIVWTVIAVLLPIVGPIAWLVAGREPRQSSAPRGHRP